MIFFLNSSNLFDVFFCILAIYPSLISIWLCENPFIICLILFIDTFPSFNNDKAIVCTSLPYWFSSFNLIGIFWWTFLWQLLHSYTIKWFLLFIGTNLKLNLSLHISYVFINSPLQQGHFSNSYITLSFISSSSDFLIYVFHVLFVHLFFY